MSKYVWQQSHREPVADLYGVKPGGAPVAALAVRDPVDQGLGLVGPATPLLYSRDRTGHLLMKSVLALAHIRYYCFPLIVMQL